MWLYNFVKDALPWNELRRFNLWDKIPEKVRIKLPVFIPIFLVKILFFSCESQISLWFKTLKKKNLIIVFKDMNNTVLHSDTSVTEVEDKLNLRKKLIRS